MSGSQPGLDTAVDALGVRGRLVVVAIHPQPRPVSLFRLFWRELTVIGARVYERADYERAVDLVAAGVVPADALISAVVPLSEAADAFVQLETWRRSHEGPHRLPSERRRVTRLFDLSGRLAVVTGARRGIGLAMAEALAEAGADIIGVSASMEAEGSVLEQRVRALRARVHRARGRLREPGGRTQAGPAAE